MTKQQTRDTIRHTRHAIIYCRVSTDKQEQDGESLEYQEEKGRRYAELHDMDVIMFLSEAKSGFIHYSFREKLMLARQMIREGLAETLTDIGSGLDTERKILQRVLTLVQDYQVADVVVTFSDRFTRFGLSYLRSLFSGYGVTLTVLHPDDATTPEQTLTEDLLAIIASFAGRMSGVRSRKQKALLACARQVLAEQEE